MTVAELIEQLRCVNQSARVIVPGYESGADDLTDVEDVCVLLNCNDQTFTGFHRVVSDGEVNSASVPAVLLHGRQVGMKTHKTTAQWAVTYLPLRGMGGAPQGVRGIGAEMHERDGIAGTVTALKETSIGGIIEVITASAGRLALELGDQVVIMRGHSVGGPFEVAPDAVLVNGVEYRRASYV